MKYKMSDTLAKMERYDEAIVVCNDARRRLDAFDSNNNIFQVNLMGLLGVIKCRKKNFVEAKSLLITTYTVHEKEWSRDMVNEFMNIDRILSLRNLGPS